MDFDGKRVTIMGLGLFGGGLGVTRFMLSQGARVTVTDLRSKDELYESVEALAGLPVRLRLGGHDEKHFIRADIVVVNPAVPRSSHYLQIARDAGVELTSEMNLFFESCPAPIVGITGSNGKSTTTALTGSILREAFPRCRVGGNIGGSLLEEISEIDAAAPVVLELSSFQLEDLRNIGLSPHISVVTNITPNHLDRHGTMDKYIAAKRAIIANQTENDWVVLNLDDETVRRWAKDCHGSHMFFSQSAEVEEGAFVRGGEIVMRQGGDEKVLCELSAIQIPGKHNVDNVLAAATAAHLAGAEPYHIQSAVEKFTGIEHRLELVAQVNDVWYYNDSIATTPESTVAALRALEERIILIAGGYDKKIDLAPMAREAVRRVKRIILIGQTAKRIEQLVQKSGGEKSPAIVHAGTLEKAVEIASDGAEPGDTVLLSPTCASYDMFRNFVDRGRKFKDCVFALSGEKVSAASAV